MKYEIDNGDEAVIDLKNAIQYKNNPDIPVIDMGAKTADELKDSYVGKYIVKCDICDQLLYSDDKDLTKIKACPYCGFDDCFYIVGIVQAVPEEEFVDEYKEDQDGLTKTELVYGEATNEEENK